MDKPITITLNTEFQAVALHDFLRAALSDNSFTNLTRWNWRTIGEVSGVLQELDKAVSTAYPHLTEEEHHGQAR